MTKRYLGILDSDNIRASEVLGAIIDGLNPSGFGEKVGENISPKLQNRLNSGLLTQR